ncbi:hypothetical protein BJY59DRAFT_269031 [Rhodotorula toruloides]
MVILAHLALSTLAALLARAPHIALVFRRPLLPFALLLPLVELLLRLEQRCERNRGELCVRGKGQLDSDGNSRRIAHPFQSLPVGGMSQYEDLTALNVAVYAPRGRHPPPSARLDRSRTPQRHPRLLPSRHRTCLRHPAGKPVDSAPPAALPPTHPPLNRRTRLLRASQTRGKQVAAPRGLFYGCWRSSWGFQPASCACESERRCTTGCGAGGYEGREKD